MVAEMAFQQSLELFTNTIYTLAAVARNVYLRPGTGAGALNEKFGGRRNGGYAPYHHADASGSIQRKVLQQLEKAGVLVQEKKGGRKVTAQGQKDMDLIAKKIKTA